MSRPWQYVLHQRVVEQLDALRPSDRRKVRNAILDLVAQPWQRPAAEIRQLNVRNHFVKEVPGFRIIYWLDAFVCEVCVVRVERR